MDYIAMNKPFLSACHAAGLTVKIRGWLSWEDFDVLYCMGGEL